MTELDWVLVAEETGYAGLPHPFVDTVAVAAPLLAAAGDPDDLLPSLLDGSRLAAVLPLGTRLVPWGDAVTLLIEVDREPTSGEWVARRVAAGVAHGERRALADVVDAGRRTVLLEAWRKGDVLGAPADAALAFDRGALGTAAQLVGLARRMVDMTVGYVGERKQFGVPIGSFQAVKHHLADAALRLEFAAPAVHGAAWAVATGAPTASRDVSMAKALASDAVRLAGRKALQAHGAIGYTTEYDLHLYLKRAEVLARTWGDAAWHRRRVGEALGL
jgi:alkylation response protein AidB-like acyl-CoA dehydrogenase